MSNLSENTIKAEVQRLGAIQSWNHDIELPFRIRTVGKDQTSHGKNLVKWQRIEPFLVQFGMEGKRVLDVGCNEGFFCLKMLELGAKEVVGIDADINRIEKAQFVADALGINDVSFKSCSVYDPDLKSLGYFDLVLCMGFIHRIPDIYNAVHLLTTMSETILVEWKALRRYNDNRPLIEYCRARNKDGNPLSNLYWSPSMAFVLTLLEDFGLSHNVKINDTTKWKRDILIASRTHLCIAPIQETENAVGSLLNRRYSQVVVFRFLTEIKKRMRTFARRFRSQ